MDSVSLYPDPSPAMSPETAASPTQHRDVPAVTSDEAAASPITRKMPTNGKHVVIIGHLRDGQIWPVMTLEQRHDVLQAIRENDEERRRLAQLIREQVLLVSGQAPQPTPAQSDL